MLSKSQLMLKTELVIFKHENKKLECQIKIKFSRKRIYPSKSVIYLVVKIDENLNWKDQTYDIVTKLNRVNVMPYKVRNYVSFNTFKAIDLAIFDSQINYANLIWGQNSNFKFRIITLQKTENKMLISNIIFINKSINNLLLPVFKNCSEIYNYDTVSLSTDKLFKHFHRTDSYGKTSIIVSDINCWNKTQNM